MDGAPGSAAGDCGWRAGGRSGRVDRSRRAASSAERALSGRGGCGQLGGEGRGGGGGGAERGRRGSIDMSARHGLPDRCGGFLGLWRRHRAAWRAESAGGACVPSSRRESRARWSGRWSLPRACAGVQLHSCLLEALFAAAGKDLMGGFRREGGLQREGGLSVRAGSSAGAS